MNLNISQKQSKQMGKEVPVELVEQLLDAGSQALFDYLTANHAPQQVIDLCSQIEIYAKFEGHKTQSKITDIESQTVSDLLPVIAENILCLGGDLIGSGGITTRKPIKWDKE
jgi:hypothetical protein